MGVFFISDVWRVEPKARQLPLVFLVSGMFIEGK